MPLPSIIVIGITDPKQIGVTVGLLIDLTFEIPSLSLINVSDFVLTVLK